MDFIGISDSEFLNLDTVATFRIYEASSPPDQKIAYLDPFNSEQPQKELAIDLVLITGREITLAGERANVALRWLTHKEAPRRSPAA